MSDYIWSRQPTLADFSSLIGKTLVSVTVDDDNDSIIFTTSTNEVFKLEHTQDCCESVYIESITGDIEDLLNVPILSAEEVSSDNHRAYEYTEESKTWTFYKLATIKGYVDIRFCGTSNGYYSESVDFFKVS